MSLQDSGVDPSVNLANELLGSEGETDVSFLKKRIKRLREALWFQERFFRKFGKFGMTFSLSFLGKEKAILVEQQLVVTCCSYCPDKPGSAAGNCKATGAVGEDLLFRHHVPLNHLHSIFLARGKVERKSPLASLATAHVHNWS